MSDFFKFEYIYPKNIILNKNNDDYGTIIDGTKSGIKINTFQQPTDVTFRSDFIGGDQNIIIAFRNDFNTNKLLYGESPQVYSINTYDPFTNEFNEGDQIIIYDTGTKYGISNSRGPYLRLGKHNIISEKPESKVGIGILFPAEKVHISGGNLRVEGNVFANNLYTKDNPSGFITGVDLSAYVTKSSGTFTNRPTVNGTGVLLSGEAAGLPTTIVYTTGNQTISGTKNFATRPQVNNIGVVISGEAYPLNNPSGFITGVDLSPYATVTNLNVTGSNLQNQINNLNNTYATDAELSGVNNALNTKINSLSGSAVLLYGNQTIDGTKTFRNSVYIHDLYVTGTEFIANVQNNFIESPYILLNLTGGAVDGGIFFVTGTGLTGVNDYGPIIGFDHTDKFKFGFARRSDDLSVLNDIAAVQDLTNYSGFANNNFYLKSNPSGFIRDTTIQKFITGMSTGIDSYTGNFTNTFSTLPVVVATMETTGVYGYVVNLTQITTSGFVVDFSDVIRESGVDLNIIAYG